MTEITIGTTPSIRYDFNIMDPSDFTQAILTIKDGDEEKIRKTCIGWRAAHNLPCGRRRDA